MQLQGQGLVIKHGGWIALPSPFWPGALVQDTALPITQGCPALGKEAGAAPRI